MRQFLIAMSVLLLGGCNMVITKTPLFPLSDAAGAPQLRKGVWRGAADKPCKFNEAKAVTLWPDCANAFVVLDGEMRSFDKDSKGKRRASLMPYVLVGGAPQVMQLRSQEGDKDASPEDQGYLYAGLRPTKTDAQGRITGLAAWPVICGPPPPGDAKTSDGKNTRYVSLELTPGLTADKEESDCTTDSQAVVHAAAAASEKLTKPESIITARWVRDGAR